MLLLRDAMLLPHLSTLLAAENNVKTGVYEFIEAQFARNREKLVNFDFSGNEICPADPDDVYILRNSKFSVDAIVSLNLSDNPLDDVGMLKFMGIVWPLDKGRCGVSYVVQLYRSSEMQF